MSYLKRKAAETHKKKAERQKIFSLLNYEIELNIKLILEKLIIAE